MVTLTLTDDELETLRSAVRDGLEKVSEELHYGGGAGMYARRMAPKYKAMMDRLDGEAQKPSGGKK